MVRSHSLHWFGLLFILTQTISMVSADIGDYVEDVRHIDHTNGLTISVDSLFMTRTDDMHSVLMRDVATGVTAFQTGEAEVGVMVGPQLNLVKSGQDGWGVGFRYFSLLEGTDSSNHFAIPGQSFSESFNGMDFGDLIQFDTFYKSTLHNFELNLRKTVRPGLTIYAGYRFLELNEVFAIHARNSLPQDPAIEISKTDLTNHLHGGQIGAAITLWEHKRFRLDLQGSTGVYNNLTRGTLYVRDNGDDNPLRTISDNQVAFVNDLSLTGNYRLTNNLSLRAGLQMMWLTDVSLAPEQTQTNSFRTDTFTVSNSNDVFYYGGFGGLLYEY